MITYKLRNNLPKGHKNKEYIELHEYTLFYTLPNSIKEPIQTISPNHSAIHLPSTDWLVEYVKLQKQSFVVTNIIDKHVPILKL